MSPLDERQPHALDRAAWTALTTSHAHLGHGNAMARRYRPEVAPFVGLADETPASYRAMRELLQPGEQVMFPSLAAVPGVEGLQARQVGQVHQMVAVRPGSGGKHELNVTALGDGDVPDMMELVQATKPGPFASRTLEMGRYIGIREGGRLVAMAGERMRLPGFTEISAVCVAGGWRGRGIAAGLIGILREQIEERGETAFLHVVTGNLHAIALYGRLGFDLRRTFALSMIGLVSPAASGPAPASAAG